MVVSPGGERLLWLAQNIPDYSGIRIAIFRLTREYCISFRLSGKAANITCLSAWNVTPIIGKK